MALVLACAVATVLPYTWRGTTCGHDFDFHLQSWLAAAQQWRYGTLYPHWIEGANFGAGEPRFIFYPPTSWMLGALAGTIFPWSAAPAAFTLSVMIGYGLSMEALARDWMPPNAATLAACAYILSPYALFVAYERTAYGELAAGIWLPLIVRYALRRAEGRQLGRSATGVKSKDLQSFGEQTHVGAPGLDSETWVPRRRSTSIAANIVGLALAIAAVWLSNAPAAVMSCYFLAAIALWTSIARRTFLPTVQAAAGLTLGMGLAAFYIVPAASQRRWVDIAHALAPGVQYRQGFLFGYTGAVFHDAVLRQISWIFVAILATIALAMAIARKRGISGRILLPLAATASVLLALQLPLTSAMWEHTPQLKFLQFPWRWTLVLSMVLAISVGMAAISRRPTSPRRSFLTVAVTVILATIGIVPTAAKLFWQYCDDDDAIAPQLNLFHSGAGYQGTDEYAPIGSDNTIVQQGLPPIRILKDADAETADSPGDDQPNPTFTRDDGEEVPSQIAIKQWRSEDKSLTVTSQAPGFCVLRLMDYPAWQVTVNGIPSNNRPHRDDGLMVVPFQPGINRVEIAYSTTPDVRWGRALSIVSLVALALTISQRRRKPQALVPRP